MLWYTSNKNMIYLSYDSLRTPCTIFHYLPSQALSRIHIIKNNPSKILCPYLRMQKISCILLDSVVDVLNQMQPGAGNSHVQQQQQRQLLHRQQQQHDQHQQHNRNNTTESPAFPPSYHQPVQPKEG